LPNGLTDTLSAAAGGAKAEATRLLLPAAEAAAFVGFQALVVAVVAVVVAEKSPLAVIDMLTS
jgi:hypothetical protein